MTNVNYQNLYEKLEDNNLPELKTVLKSKESIFEFLKFQSIEDNSNTPLLSLWWLKPPSFRWKSFSLSRCA